MQSDNSESRKRNNVRNAIEYPSYANARKILFRHRFDDRNLNKTLNKIKKRITYASLDVATYPDGTAVLPYRRLDYRDLNELGNNIFGFWIYKILTPRERWVFPNGPPPPFTPVSLRDLIDRSINSYNNRAPYARGSQERKVFDQLIYLYKTMERVIDKQPKTNNKKNKNRNNNSNSNNRTNNNNINNTRNSKRRRVSA